MNPLDQPLWFTAEDIRDIHDQILDPDNLPGESPDISLESTLQRVENQVRYDQIENDVLSIAIAYCVAILRGHCFIDGNKRSGLIALTTYLHLHQVVLDIDQDYIAEVMILAAAGTITDRILVDVIRGHLVALDTSD